jgi:hypothetical protein
MDWMDPRIYGRITTEKPPIIPVPLDVINEVKAARLAGKQDLEIVDPAGSSRVHGHGMEGQLVVLVGPAN